MEQGLPVMESTNVSGHGSGGFNDEEVNGSSTPLEEVKEMLDLTPLSKEHLKMI